MDQKNLILAIVLSVAIIMGWQHFFSPAKPPIPAGQTATTQPGAPTPPPGQTAPGQAGVQPGAPAVAPVQVVSRAEALDRSPRVTFSTPELVGSIALKGGRIDDVQLVKYRVTIDPASPPVPVLSPVGSEHPYYAEFGWTAADPSTKVPGRRHGVDGRPGHRGAGQAGQAHLGQWPGPDLRARHLARRILHVRRQAGRREQVRQAGDALSWSLVVRYGEPKAEGIYILHEGPYGVFNGSLKEWGYSDFKDNKQQKIATTGGWVGITDKYWMATLVPDQKTKVDVSIKQTGAAADLKYQIDYVGPGVAVAPGPPPPPRPGSSPAPRSCA